MESEIPSHAPPPGLADVLDVPAIQALMDDFHALTGIGVGIIDLQGTVLVATGWQDICTKFHRVHPDAARHCAESDTALSTGVAPGEYKLYRCRNHLWDMATPIVVGDRHLGNLFLGQFFFDDEQPDEALFRAQARQYGFDEAAYLAALARVPRWSRRKVDLAMAFYARLARQISELGFRNLQLNQALAEQRRAEDALRASEERYRSILNASPDDITIADLEGRVLMVSPSGLRMFGYKQPEAMAGRPVTDFVAPEDRARALEKMADLFRNGGPVSGEFRGLRADGATFAIEVNAEFVRDPHGQPRQVLLVVRDISQRRQAEEKLRASAERFQDIAANLPGVIFQLQVGRTGTLEVPYMSSGCEALFGRPVAGMDFAGLLFDHMHVGDRSLFLHSVDAAARQLDHWSLEFRVEMPDRRAKWLRGSAKPRRLASGAILWNGVLLDITALRRAEESLREREAFQHLLLDTIPSPVFYKDRQGRYLGFNRAFEEFYGQSKDQLVGKSVSDIAPPELARIYNAKDAELLEKPGVQIYESEVVDALGRRHDAVFHKASITDANGRVTGLIGIIHDITERTRAEQQMAGQLDELRRWYAATLDREERVAELKREVNAWAARAGQPPPYPSAAPAPPEAAP